MVEGTEPPQVGTLAKGRQHLSSGLHRKAELTGAQLLTQGRSTQAVGFKSIQAQMANMMLCTGLELSLRDDKRAVWGLQDQCSHRQQIGEAMAWTWPE